MDSSNANRVVPVVTSRPEVVREAMIRQLDASAASIAFALRDNYGDGHLTTRRVLRNRRDVITNEVRAMREAVAVLDQIGWRP